MMKYSCTCCSGVSHTHEANADDCHSRGVHLPDSGGESKNYKTFAKDEYDSVAGMLWGMFIADALGAPLHWYYTWSAAQEHKQKFYKGGLTGYASVHPEAQAAHPDSAKYFVRCNPSEQPVDIFNGHAGLWNGLRRAYHGTLPAGDNTLTGRLVARALACVVDSQGVNASAWLQEYTRTLCSPPGTVHNDTWVDETHRVFWRNVCKGAAPEAAGMDDVCLTGLCLSIPALLTYAHNRDAAALALRAQLQFTHKSEDMVSQSLVLGDLLATILSAATATATAIGQEGMHAPQSNNSVDYRINSIQETSPLPLPLTAQPLHQYISSVYSWYSPPGSTSADLNEVLHRGLSDVQAYHGPTVVFSAR